MTGKGFVRKFPRSDGTEIAMLVMLTDGLGELDDETLYAFEVNCVSGAVVMHPLDKRQTDDFRGCNASGIIARL